MEESPRRFCARLAPLGRGQEGYTNYNKYSIPTTDLATYSCIEGLQENFIQLHSPTIEVRTNLMVVRRARISRCH